MKSKINSVDILILLAYVGLIYSTLYIAPKIFLILSGILEPYADVVVNTALVALALLLVFLFYNRLKDKGIGVCLGIIVILNIYGLVLVRFTPIIAEKVHLIEYGFLGYLALRVFRRACSRDTAYLYVILTVISVGYFDELIQKFLPNRVYDIRDVYLNVLSGLLGLALTRLLG